MSSVHSCESPPGWRVELPHLQQLERAHDPAAVAWRDRSTAPGARSAARACSSSGPRALDLARSARAARAAAAAAGRARRAPRAGRGPVPPTTIGRRPAASAESISACASGMYSPGRERARERARTRPGGARAAPALAGVGRAGQDLQALVDLERVGRDRDRVLAARAQQVGQLDRHARSCRPRSARRSRSPCAALRPGDAGEQQLLARQRRAVADGRSPPATSSPGRAEPGEVDASCCGACGRAGASGSVRDGPSTSTSIVRPTKRCARSGALPLDGLDEPLHPLALDRVRQLVRAVRRLGAAPRREDEREGASRSATSSTTSSVCSKSSSVSPGKPTMMSVVIAQSGTCSRIIATRSQVALAVVGAAHRLEDAARAGLERQVDVLAQRRQLGVRADHVLAHVLRVRARVADALDPVDRVDRPQQLGEARPGLLRQVAAVGVHVLARAA